MTEEEAFPLIAAAAAILDAACPTCGAHPGSNCRTVQGHVWIYGSVHQERSVAAARVGATPIDETPEPTPKRTKPPEPIVTFDHVTGACSRCGATVPASPFPGLTDDVPAGTYPRDLHEAWHANLRATLAAVADALEALAASPVTLVYATGGNPRHHPSVPQRPARF